MHTAVKEKMGMVAFREEAVQPDRHFFCIHTLSSLFTLEALFCIGYNTFMSPIDCQQLEGRVQRPD